MKLWLFSTLFTFLVFAEPNESLTADPLSSGGEPSIEWLVPLEHDFGDLEQGNPVEHQFKFINHHDEPITIDNIRTTCGCTAPNWSADPIEAGATDVIKITYDARKTGYFRKKIKVYFNHQRKAETLFIEGFVLEE
jgi:hypothetical protein